MRMPRIAVSLFFFGGLALLGGMIWQVGLTNLLGGFQTLGLWIIPYLLLKGIRIIIDTAGWASCFPGNRLAIPFWHLLLVSRAGGAVNHVTPTATVGGEIVKVLLLESHLSREQATATVFIDKATSTLANMLFLTLGMFYLTQRLPLPVELYLSLTVGISLITLGLIGFVVFQRYGALSKLVHRLGRFPIGRQYIQRLSKQLVLLDEQLVAYYTRYPWRFVQSLLLHFVADLFGIVKTYILLSLLLGANRFNFADAAMVTIAVGGLDQIFFFVPARLGVLEGTRFMVLSLLGVAQVYGLTVGILARVEQLFWSGVGFLAYWFYVRYVIPETIPQSVDVSPLS